MAEQQGPPADNIVFNQFAGLKNTVPLERLGPTDLSKAVNVDIDDVGAIKRRRGFSKVADGSFHSLFHASNGLIYGVKDNVLGIISTNYLFTALRSNIGPTPLSYVSVGEDVYFSSLTDSGIIHLNNTVSDWGAVVDDGFWYSPVVNPTSNLPPVRGKQLSAPPMATALAYWNGRIYLANERTLWATELYLYNYVDKTKNYKYFESNITVIGNVSDGLYVGTDESLWFLNGTFNELKRVHLGDMRCIPGTMVGVSQELALPSGRANPTISEKVDDALLVMSSVGLLLLASGGSVYNLTQDRVWFPDAQSGTALFRRQDGINQYLSVLDSGGTPASNARIGDYCDATIIRGGLV